MTAGQSHEAEIESRWEAAPAVGAVVVLQVALATLSAAAGWSLWKLGWWAWLIPVPAETLLVVVLTWERGRRRLSLMGIRREVIIGLLAVVGASNAFLLVALLASLLAGTAESGAQLLAEGAAVWLTNVVAFGLWFWVFDRGGPVERLRRDAPPPDFQFPQMENPELAAPGWTPHFVDYLYVSFTNSIAFSPTDAMPLTRPAKLLMLLEAGVSAVTVLLVAARAVNILT